MKIKTGQTVYELVVSTNTENNNPISGVTFEVDFFIDGALTSSIVPTISYANQSAATYNFIWSASTVGVHQFYAKNNTTNVIYISDEYYVLPNSEVDPSATVYVGL